ncbi:MAG: hypothetical protein XXXJIFNMEKO3_03212 [Candidatus Erwinia impunctatus]|nr:hypothetical protein XXXJIFNMEKO_03212 [Culicoides impunctatus]
MTVSIVGRCAKTGQLGIAISSSSMAVGARCPWLMSGVGAVSTQNITLPSLGPATLAHLAAGASPVVAMEKALNEDPFRAWRQVIVLDNRGNSALFSGENTLGVHHAQQGNQCVAAGNMLSSPQVISAMIESFEKQSGTLATRLLHALRAGFEAGGEAGSVHSAAVKVTDKQSWPLVDLRIDWAEHDPISALESLWQGWQPQMNDYITRAIDPREAPRYGVPGDE